MPEGFGIPPTVSPTNAQPMGMQPVQLQQQPQQATWAPGMPVRGPQPISPANRQAARPQPQQQLPFRRVYYKTLQKGSLVSCQYTFWKHDPSPLIVVTDVFPDRIRGVNLHYLTFNYVKSLLSHYCGKGHFNYKFIMHDPYIVNAFRTYKKAGLRKVQMLDCDIINQELKVRRSFNPQEIKEIRKQIRQQLRRRVNPNAAELAKQYTEMVSRASGFQQPGIMQDGRKTFQPQIPQVLQVPQGTIPGRPASIPGQPASG